ncbi:hypothetical protein SAICODRAFT_181239 [Saitoella complicata NRRL Y-17804]|uniref:uncharacterized protein n=1 Tax=Saitoella complicata (strain BCRC 22490 / CBS 7301 / JCM 7358 / NBRC 10748 / NRRL Y-17804) TaxID=698492 RepID=UPI000867DD86|nr:uncharacterized protein SAICODRAFT_181239 [Saitoella complicata NRRL Y-17804]ODQ50067.1 hypothetical protein SAICODRAFT_181239 [Saitoella complicata NRRL Y-17804]
MVSHGCASLLLALQLLLCESILLQLASAEDKRLFKFPVQRRLTSSTSADSRIPVSMSTSSTSQSVHLLKISHLSSTPVRPISGSTPTRAVQPSTTAPMLLSAINSVFTIRRTRPPL